jgi:hypothetical protein
MMDIDRDGKVSKEELINALLVISSRSHWLTCFLLKHFFFFLKNTELI